MQKLPKIPNVIKTFGNSMFPLLLDGDILYLKKINFSKIKTNDIITAKDKDHYFTHRVIYKTSKYFLTKGDNSPYVDKKTRSTDFFRIVDRVKRQGKIFYPEQIYLIQSSLYFQEIVKIKHILENQNLEMVFLKGLPIHLYFEDAHPRRLYADCDILIKRKDFMKLKIILQKQGYKKIEDSLSKQHKNMKNKESEISFSKIMNGFNVTFDVHFEIVFMMTQLGELNSLYPQKMIDSLTKEFMEKKMTIKVRDEIFPILSIENLIIYLCLHLFHHNFLGSYRYELIDKIIRKNKSKDNLVTDVIDRHKLNSFVYPCFMLLKKYYISPIPKKILKDIKPKEASVLDFIKDNLLNLNIFDQENRISSGVNRFKIIFYLSPIPIARRVFVFLNPEVIYSIFWVLSRKLDGIKSKINPVS